MPAPEVIPWPDEPMKDFLDGPETAQPIHPPDVLFAKITDEQVTEWEKRFGGVDGQ
jgi:methionyl-tRNA synthetase